MEEEESAMNTAVLTPLLRMTERSLIVVGGILAIYLGYRLFVLGIDKSQGTAAALGVQLKDFGPGLFFAALGAVILVTTMRAAIKVGPEAGIQPLEGATSAAKATAVQTSNTATSPSALFLGIEDSKRVAKGWTETAFFLETRQMLRRLDAGETPDKLTDLRTALKTKLDSITMSAEEYRRYQDLTQTLPLDEREQKELISLERKIFP
jgi:hypothetical protein